MNNPVQDSLEVIEHTRWVYTVKFNLSTGTTILFSVRNCPVVENYDYTTKQQCEVTVDNNPMLVYDKYEHATAYIQELIDGNNIQAQG